MLRTKTLRSLRQTQQSLSACLPSTAQLKHAVRSVSTGGAVGKPLATKAQAGDFPGFEAIWGATSEYTTDKQWQDGKEQYIPTYRVMDEEGEIVNPNYVEDLDEEMLVKMYKTMIKTNICDTIFYDAQRTGRISFYMTNYVEEGCQVASAQALTLDDVVFAQYRELAVHLWRGLSVQEVADFNYSNYRAHGRGVQMPISYGSKKINLQTIGTTLATQIPHAVGCGYALRQKAEMGTGPDAVSIVYFGEGAASEGDSLTSLNFAATLDCRTIFFVRNNGFAISTPVENQYRGNGIAPRGPAFGIKTIRVDGNDPFAVNEVTKEARAYIIENNAPVLIEAMTYRGGHHSTSDDATRYRDVETIEYWMKYDNPTARIFKYMERKGWWNKEQDDEFRKTTRKMVMDCVKSADKAMKPPIAEMFSDVYSGGISEEPWYLTEQREECLAHVAKYKDTYDAYGPWSETWEPTTHEWEKSGKLPGQK